MIRSLWRFQNYVDGLPAWKLYGVPAALLLGGMQLGYLAHKSTLDERRELEPGTAHDMIATKLSTGDVILFNNSTMSYKPMTLLTRLVTKWSLKDEVDHVAVVVRRRDEDLPYLLEQTRSGIQMFPYDQRLLHSTANEIVLRPLQVSRSKAMMDAVDEVVNEIIPQTDVSGRWNPVGKRDSLPSRLFAPFYTVWASQTFLKDSRVGKLGEYLNFQDRRREGLARIQQLKLQREQLPKDADEDTAWNLEKELEKVVKNYKFASEDLGEAKEILEVQTQQLGDVSDKNAVIPATDVVLRVLDAMGVIARPSTPSSSSSASTSASSSSSSSFEPAQFIPFNCEYLPTHFMHAHLPLLRSASFGAPVYLKSKHEAVPYLRT